MHGRQVSLQHVSTDTLSKVKRLNSVLFPVQYGHSFYKALLMPDQHAMLAHGGSPTLQLASCQRPGAPAVLEAYIMTLGVLAPYRRLGVGKVLLDSAVRYARADPAVRRLVLHVHITNDDALRFYHASGFSTVRIVENYYRRIEQPHAYLLEYRVR
ncbi:acyl-CoA N-acyltransferase [Linderina pennispora]|uniref:Acyl-CoA N-acyltransferase n=1 Tax=Linderina pennispora TaxID=61395 RepID=A0A1Y1WP14_9FUNG|nr:acyl-CoA N-acyltransferase [Linderina pennispora]ORX74874.1 acyl-CoA N-acyltransferase [Linderina pennispora]